MTAKGAQRREPRTKPSSPPPPRCALGGTATTTMLTTTTKGRRTRGRRTRGQRPRGATSGPQPGGGEAKSRRRRRGAQTIWRAWGCRARRRGFEVPRPSPGAHRRRGSGRVRARAAQPRGGREVFGAAAAKDFEGCRGTLRRRSGHSTRTTAEVRGTRGTSRPRVHKRRRSAASASRRCPRVCVRAQQRASGFKAVPSQRLGWDSEYLNGVAASLEARAVRVGGDVASGAMTTYAPGGDPSRRRHEIERTLGSRRAPSALRDGRAHDSPRRRTSRRAPGRAPARRRRIGRPTRRTSCKSDGRRRGCHRVAEDGILRASSVVVPKRNA